MRFLLQSAEDGFVSSASPKRAAAPRETLLSACCTTVVTVSFRVGERIVAVAGVLVVEQGGDPLSERRQAQRDLMRLVPGIEGQ